MITERIKLRNNVSIVMGQAPKGTDCNFEGEGVPFVKAGEFGVKEPIIREWTTNPLKMAQKNDILICVVGATAGKLNLGIEAAIGRSVAAIRCNECIYNKYLYYCLQPWILRIRSQSQGSAVGVITKDMLEEIEIPLPNYEVQQNIANILDKAQELIDKRKQQIEACDELIKSQFIEMFGDPAKNPMGWGTTNIGEACYFVKDGPHTSPTYVEEGVPFVSVNNIVRGSWDFDNIRYISEEDYEIYAKRCCPEKGDILYTKGGTTGIAKYVDIDLKFINWVHIAVLKFDDRLNGVFFENMLNTSYCYTQSQLYTRGIANRDLVLGEMKKIKFYVPPRELQDQFAQFVQQIDRLKFEMQQSLTELENNFNALMQKAFKAELF